MRRIVLVLLLGFLASYCLAQVRVHRSLIAPMRPAEGCWWLDTKTQYLKHFIEGEWKLSVMSRGVRHCEICNDLIIGHYQAGYYEIVSNIGHFVGGGLEIVECIDNVVVTGTSHPQYVVDNRPNILIDKRYLTKIAGNSDSIYPMELQGRACYVAALGLPTYFLSDSIVNYVCWGVIDTHGDWIIEPRFDAPFQFQNGVAEVIYYSQRRKINEKGEFVN